jgi:hypothetical protein
MQKAQTSFARGRRLVLILVFLTLGVGCGQARSNGATNSDTEIDLQDQARAERVVFHRSDFPTGWSLEAAQTNGGRVGAILHCLQLRWSDLTPTGSSNSKISEDSTSYAAFETTFTASAVAIYASEDQARIAFERVSSDAFEPTREELVKCFKSYAQNHVTGVSFRQVPAPQLIDAAAVHQVGKSLVGPSLTDDAAAYKVEMTLIDTGGPAYDDVVVLRNTRSIAVLTFFQAYLEWDEYEEEALANTVARRMAFDTGSPATQVPQTLPAVSCGELRTAAITKIKARHVSCVRARRIVRQWLAQCERAGTDPCLQRRTRFYCTTLDASYRYNDIGCVYQPDLRKPITAQRTVLFQLGT